MTDTIHRLRDELGRRRGTWREVCEGADLNYWWLIKFAQGRIKNPGYEKIQRLDQFLSQQSNPPSAIRDRR